MARAASPEHVGYGEEVVKGPLASNQTFSLLIQQDQETPKPKIYLRNTKY